MISLDTGLWQRGPSGSFSPLQLSPALWLDASDASTLFQSNGGAAAAADGDPVGYWLDKSGNGKHASQTSGVNKPVLKTGIQNAKNIVRANGSSAFFDLASLSYPMPFTMCLVYKKSASAAKFIPIGHFSDTSTHIGETWTDNIFYGRHNTSGITYCSFKSTATVNDYSAFVLLDTTGGSSIADLYINSSSISIGDNSNPTMLSILNTIFKSSADFSSGDLGEIIVFPRKLGATDRTSIRTYLKTKWGTP